MATCSIGFYYFSSAPMVSDSWSAQAQLRLWRGTQGGLILDAWRPLFRV
jgi:hypothetical protein